MPHTVTSSLVLDRLARLEADKSLTRAQVLQGLRTLVHEELQAQCPPPYPLPPPAAGKTHEDFVQRYDAARTLADKLAIHDEELAHLAERKLAMLASVSREDQLAFLKAKGRPETYGIRDAHHFAQKEHGRKLWEEADRLIAAAGVVQ